MIARVPLARLLLFYLSPHGLQLCREELEKSIKVDHVVSETRNNKKLQSSNIHDYKINALVCQLHQFHPRAGVGGREETSKTRGNDCADESPVAIFQGYINRAGVRVHALHACSKIRFDLQLTGWR